MIGIFSLFSICFPTSVRAEPPRAGQARQSNPFVLVSCAFGYGLSLIISKLPVFISLELVFYSSISISISVQWSILIPNIYLQIPSLSKRHSSQIFAFELIEASRIFSESERTTPITVDQFLIRIGIGGLGLR